MRIAVNAIRVSGKLGGGFDHVIVELTNHLAKQGAPIDVYTLHPEHFSHVPARHVIKVMTALTAKRQEDKRNQKSSPQLPKTNNLSKLAFSVGDAVRMFWTQFVFPLHILRKNYDVILAPSQLDALPYPIRPQVIFVHDLIPFIFPNNPHKHRFYLKKILPLALKNSKFILAPSQNTKKDLEEILKIPAQKITVAYDSYDSVLYHPANPNEVERVKEKYNLNQYILSVSSNLPHKNWSGLIQAFSLIKEETSCDLVLVGYLNLSHQKQLEEQIRSGGLRDRVKFLGHIPVEDLGTLYSGAELFVFPSLYEGFGIPPLEALACGIPVVVSRVASLPEVVGDAGIYVNPQDPTDMANGLRQGLNNTGLREKLRKLGQIQTQKFSWEKTASIVLGVLEKAVTNST